MQAHLEAPGAIGLSHPPITPIHPVATIHPIPHVPLVAAPTPILPAIPRTQYSPPGNALKIYITQSPIESFLVSLA